MVIDVCFFSPDLWASQSCLQEDAPISSAPELPEHLLQRAREVSQKSVSSGGSSTCFKNQEEDVLELALGSTARLRPLLVRVLAGTEQGAQPPG